MRIYVGVTDPDWFRMLADLRPEEVNFWQPGGKQAFRALRSNELFLFKLHSPIDRIVGGGFFVRQSFLPVSLAWEAFGRGNGANDVSELKRRLYRYRRTDPGAEPDPSIGCIVIAEPFFFPQDQWIPAPESWKKNIVQGKTYDTETSEGWQLLRDVEQRLHASQGDVATPTEMVLEGSGDERFGTQRLITPRLGQGAFRVVVMEAYQRRCAITGEKTLPVLDASHIKPYALEGPHSVANGVFLRQDFHTLFDRGYVTINEDFRVEISRRIKEDFGNGREYYAIHGKPLAILPKAYGERPAREYLRWHNEAVYLG